ncbi:hypothetical protein CKO25_09595 [Thiocapsa imhoffii]|uniref:Methyltransferase type 11 domain-containing protein n=1 Tax=Thiocapsa imhoffii TaxID=382777 RepID=A0A9X1B942_9GAMM|nr:methyltransferase domain-containing protein [Thiocapsa imhoffii]MBK1644898.1 hypothetical protein [Thiocapsa imhoffii]
MSASQQGNETMQSTDERRIETDEFILALDYSWSNDYALGLSGWVVGKSEPVDALHIEVDGVRVAVDRWQPRPDLLAAHAQHAPREHCGFVVELPRRARHELCVTATLGARTASAVLSSAGFPPPAPSPYAHGGGLYSRFVNLVNARELHVMEIGSRVVSPDSISKRDLFAKAASYTGFDYYPDRNTDVVGDAHRLASYFPDRRFEAIFSVSVMEHLAMPWVVALEINKCLEIGGLTFHATHFSWPLHEQPWDFWRFTDQGLKVLFGPQLGFEILASGLYAPLRMHLDEPAPSQELFPANTGFGGVAILAKKVADYDPERFRWDATLPEVVGTDSVYPEPQPSGSDGSSA